MRAIDADALIDDLKHDVAVDQDSLDYEELTDSNRENIQFDKDCKQNAIDLLQQAPTIEPQQRWIPCSERLPKKIEGRYWVCTNTGYQCQCRWTDDVYGFGLNGEWAWKIFDIPQYSHVIAWMPLPKPYREDGGE